MSFFLKLFKHTNNYIKNIVLYSIRLYQMTLSPDTGWFRVYYPHGYCRYTPTCSEYTYQAVKKFGTIKGLLKGLWRILRCNPWSQGGHDPIN